MLGLIAAVVGLAIVLHIIAKVFYRVVGTIATNGTSKVEFRRQAVLLDETVRGQRHGTTLRVTYTDALPVILKLGKICTITIFNIGFEESQSVAHAIYHLARSQLLIEVWMGAILGNAVALVVGHDDQTARLTDKVITRITYLHAYIGHPR